MHKASFFKTYRKPLITGTVIGVALAIVILVFGQSVLNVYYQTPSGRIRALYDLRKTICQNHIYANLDEDPLAIAYAEYVNTDVIPDTRTVKQLIKTKIQEDPNVYYTLANIMLSHYDRYSNLSAPEVYEQLYPENENYTGLGASITAYGPFIRISSVYPDSAAGRAGLCSGDLICSIGDTDIRMISYQQAQRLLSESLESETKLGILRPDEPEILYFEVQAEEVVIPNISWSIDGEIAYLNITLFRGDSFKEDINLALKKFQTAHVRYLILDLRDNRGGLISYLEFLLNRLIVEKGTLLFTEHYRDKDVPFFSEGGGVAFDDIVVLVNAQTCSSAEVVSGCLKDLGYTLIGETTYGKAVGLSNLNFYGDKLVLATMTLELPETGDYNDQGIEPTFEVKNEFAQMVLPVCLPIDLNQSISADSTQSDILAMEQRLVLLGYLFSSADGIWDENTDAALTQFYTANDTEYTQICDKKMLEKLDQLTSSLLNAHYPEDTQLDQAYAYFHELLQQAA